VGIFLGFSSPQSARMVLRDAPGPAVRRGIRWDSYRQTATPKFVFASKVTRLEGEETLAGEGVEGFDDQGATAGGPGRVGS